MNQNNSNPYSNFLSLTLNYDFKSIITTFPFSSNEAWVQLLSDFQKGDLIRNERCKRFEINSKLKNLNTSYTFSFSIIIVVIINIPFYYY